MGMVTSVTNQWTRSKIKMVFFSPKIHFFSSDAIH